MKSALRILVIEDELPAFALIQQHLHRQLPAVDCARVDRASDLSAKLEEGAWDVILSDHDVPGMSLESTLQLIRQRDPDLPVILLAGRIGEEKAVELLKLGVSDLVLKESPARLAPVIAHSLQEAQDRQGRRQAEQSLAEEVERRRNFMAQSRDGIVVLDRDGLVHEANQRFANLLGRPLAEVQHLHVWDWDARWSRDELLLRVAKIDDAGDLFETRFRRRDGSLLDVEVSANLSRGRDHLLFCVCRDIGPRKQARQDLEEKLKLQDQLSKVAASVPGVIYSLRLRPDGSTCFPYASPSLRNIFGLTFEDLAQDGRPVFDAIHPDDLAALQDGIALSARNLSPWCGVFRLRRADAEEIWLEGHSLPQREADGSTLWHGFVADVTERKRADAALQASERQIRHKEAMLRALLDSIPDLVFFKDPESIYLGCNKAFEVYAGMSEQELIGKSDFDVASREVAECFRQMDREILSGGKPLRREEWIPFHAGGGAQFDTVKAPFYGPDGRVVGMIGISRDITDRLRAQQALDESRERYRSLFDSMQGGCAYCRMIEEEGCAPDYLHLEVNPAFERLTGLSAKGRRISELIPGLYASNPTLFETYSRVVRTGKPEVFEEYVEALKNWFSISVYRPAPGHFVVVFDVITARKQAEMTLRQSEERFRVLFDRVSKLAVQGYAADGTVRLWNKASEELYGYTADEAIGRNLVDLIIPPAMREYVRDAVRQMVESGMGIPADEVMLMRKDGTLVPVFSNHTVVDVPGRGKELYCIDIDLTERKRAEAELLRTEERLTLAIATAQLGVWEWDLPTGQVLCSPECMTIFGWKNDKASAQQFAESLHPEDAAQALKQAEDALASRSDFAREYRIVRGDGQVRWLSDRAHVRCNDAGQPACIVGTVQDITERKEKEHGLRLQSAALEAAANAIVITDRHGVIEWANPAFSTITGFAASEAIGKNPRELIKSAEHTAAFYEHMWSTILAGQVWRGEIINRRKDGTLYTEDMTITPVRDEHGAVVRFIAIKQDISDQKNMEAQLLRTQRLESVGRLASGIAHDLNNILSPMLLSPPILREAIRDPAVLDVVDSIESSAERGAAIIKQLLAFGRGTGGQRVPIQLRSLVREMMKIIEETFPKNITARSSMPADLLLVNADATQLHQVLMNLCVNARDAMPEGGQLTVELATVEVDEAMAQANAGAQVGRYVMLGVSDTGCGIAPEVADKIFDPFFTTKGVGEGTGLGLSTVLGIVRSHKGFIQMDSQPERGTTFRIYLPACAVGGVGAAKPEDTPLPQGRGETVLLVDDEENVRRVARRMLEQNGYNVLEAGGGKEALEVYASRGRLVNVVLTDLLMPVMDGPTFIRELRKKHPDVRIISMSGYLTQPELMHALETETLAFLPKPFGASALLSTLRRVLSG